MDAARQSSTTLKGDKETRRIVAQLWENDVIMSTRISEKKAIQHTLYNHG